MPLTIPIPHTPPHGYIPPTLTHLGGMGMGWGIRQADPYPYPMIPISTTHHQYVIPMSTYMKLRLKLHAKSVFTEKPFVIVVEWVKQGGVTHKIFVDRGTAYTVFNNRRCSRRDATSIGVD